MALKLSEMQAKTAEHFLEFDGERIDYSYRPNVFTLADAEDVTAKVVNEDGDEVTLTLAPMMIWWDVLDEDGNRIPPTIENMRGLPLRFLSAVLESIMKHQADGPNHKG